MDALSCDFASICDIGNNQIKIKLSGSSAGPTGVDWIGRKSIPDGDTSERKQRVAGLDQISLLIFESINTPDNNWIDIRSANHRKPF